MFKVELYNVYVLSKNSSFRENVIVTTSNFVPNHYTVQEYMLSYSINFNIIIIPICNFIQPVLYAPSSDQLDRVQVSPVLRWYLCIIYYKLEYITAYD